MPDKAEADMDSDNSNVQSDFSEDSNPIESGSENPENSAASCRIFNTNVSKRKNFILSKAKKDADVKETEEIGIEIVDESGNALKDIKSEEMSTFENLKKKARKRIEKLKQAEADMDSDNSHVQSGFSEDSNPIESDSEIPGNSAWADAMCRVLNTNITKKKNFILSKAKKDADVKEKETEEMGIEIVDESGNTLKDIKSEKMSFEDFKKEARKRIEKQKQKTAWETMCRVKPDITQKDKERELMRITTRGVVHLFNTVEKHQKIAKDPREKHAKRQDSLNILKGTFMDILKGHSKRELTSGADPANKKVREEETWSILKDDFMMGAEMKDWDKESDND